MILYTIGHGNHLLSIFIRLLLDNKINLLVDVRTSPYSRHNPQYNREFLETALTRAGIKYVFAGKQLGGRPSDPGCYKSRQIPNEEADYLHEVDYPEVMKREWFLTGIDRLLEQAREERTAILCSEENPAHCHRHHLISKYIMENIPEIEILHIRGDGTIEKARNILNSVNEPQASQPALF